MAPSAAAVPSSLATMRAGVGASGGGAGGSSSSSRSLEHGGDAGSVGSGAHLLESSVAAGARASTASMPGGAGDSAVSPGSGLPEVPKEQLQKQLSFLPLGEGEMECKGVGSPGSAPRADLVLPMVQIALEGTPVAHKLSPLTPQPSTMGQGAIGWALGAILCWSPGAAS